MIIAARGNTDESDGISCERLSVLLLFARRERSHVHVISADGEAKFWLEPEVALAKNQGFRQHQLSEIESLIGDHYDELLSAWQRHFGD